MTECVLCVIDENLNCLNQLPTQLPGWGGFMLIGDKHRVQAKKALADTNQLEKGTE